MAPGVEIVERQNGERALGWYTGRSRLRAGRFELTVTYLTDAHRAVASVKSSLDLVALPNFSIQGNSAVT